MNSSQIRKFEEKIKNKMNIDVELSVNSHCSYNQYHLYYLPKEYLNQQKEKERQDSIKFNTYFKRIIFNFNALRHPNCGMDILQNINIPTFNSNIFKEINEKDIVELFKFTLRTIYPKDTNVYSFFSFQQPNYFDMMKKLDFKKLANYKNYNHKEQDDRAIWLLDLSNYEDLCLEKDNKKIKTKKATRAEIVKKVIARRRGRTTISID